MGPGGSLNSQDSFCAFLQLARQWSTRCLESRVSFLWACQIGPLVSLFGHPGSSSLQPHPEGLCRGDSREVCVGHVTKVLFLKFLILCCQDLHQHSAGSDHYIHSWCPSILNFQNQAKQNRSSLTVMYMVWPRGSLTTVPVLL